MGTVETSKLKQFSFLFSFLSLFLELSASEWMTNECLGWMKEWIISPLQAWMEEASDMSLSWRLSTENLVVANSWLNVVTLFGRNLVLLLFSWLPVCLVRKSNLRSALKNFKNYHFASWIWDTFIPHPSASIELHFCLHREARPASIELHCCLHWEACPDSDKLHFLLYWHF